MRFKIANLRLQLGLPGANELTYLSPYQMGATVWSARNKKQQPQKYWFWVDYII